MTKHVYTIKLTQAQQEVLERLLEERNWAAYELAHARFAYKNEGVNVVCYESGKLVVQGKGTEDFVSFMLEPEVTLEARLGYDTVSNPEWFESHAGMDECGKGDLFGPLVVACVVADESAVHAWLKGGVQDSKTMSQGRILSLAKQIRETPKVVCETSFCSMAKYNALMAKPRANLNHLLAWLHARCLEKALQRRFVPWALLDQFSKQPLVQRYLSAPENFELRMRTKAESDPVVAAASIIARATFLDKMDALSQQLGTPIPRGAGPKAKAALRSLYRTQGSDVLNDYVKRHFKTVSEVMAEGT